MKYDKLFSYCLKNDKPVNVHQFHYVDSGEEPTTFDWENWIAGKLYFNIQLSFYNGKFEHIDLSSAKDKKEQLRSFLDYHYLKYGDIYFLYEVKELINLFEVSLRSCYKIDSDYMEFVNGIMRDWCEEKESESILSNKTKPTNNIQSNKEEKDFKDYLLCVEEQKETMINKLRSILDGAKPKKIASVLLALNELGYIALNDGTRASMYRGYYKSFGYSSLKALERGVNIQLNPNKNNGNTIIDEIDTYIKQLKENNI